MLTIRRARPADADVVLSLITALAVYEREPDAVELTRERLAEQLASPSPPFECLLAEQAGVSCGFALFFQSYSTWRGKPGLYLEDLFVVPEQRGKGVGKALLRALAQICVERGYARMEWAVLNWNTPAIEVYRALGALPMDEWTTYRLSGHALNTLAQPLAQAATKDAVGG